MTVPSRDRILVAGAVLLAVGSAAAFGMLTWRQTQNAPVAIPRIQLPDTAYTPSVTETPIAAAPWNPPVPQSRGRDWVFDTFTPPEIFYHARSRQFTVRPPSGVLEGDAEEPFGLELVAVRPEPFRLQLIGFVGGPGTWRGTFENHVTGEVFLADAGRHLAALGVTITRFSVEPQPVTLSESMTTHQLVAVAVVRDERSGRDITLTHRERQMTGTVTAVVALSGGAGTREVRSGDGFTAGQVTYRVERIQLMPPQIDVSKESPGSEPSDRRTLIPRESEANAIAVDAAGG